MALHEFLSVFVVGAFSSGKTTFIKTVSDALGSVMTRQIGPGVLGCVPCGRVNFSEEFTLLLYEAPHPSGIVELPGKGRGVIVIVNTDKPETFRETRSLIDTFYAYTFFPIIIVANTYRGRVNPSMSQPENYRSEEESEIETLRSALHLDASAPSHMISSIPIVEYDISNREEARSVLQALIQTPPRQPLTKGLDKVRFEVDILSAEEHFTPDRTHRLLMAVSTVWWFGAHYFMDILADKDVWLILNEGLVPRRWGYCEVDKDLMLHIVPTEDFTMPKNRVGFAVQSLVATVEGKTPPSPVAEDTLSLNEGVIGCIGLFDRADSHCAQRVQQLVKAFAGYPYVLVDVTPESSTSSASSVDETSLNLPPQTPILRATSSDKTFAQKAMYLLRQQLPQVDSERLESKFTLIAS